MDPRNYKRHIAKVCGAWKWQTQDMLSSNTLGCITQSGHCEAQTDKYMGAVHSCFTTEYHQAGVGCYIYRTLPLFTSYSLFLSSHQKHCSGLLHLWWIPSPEPFHCSHTNFPMLYFAICCQKHFLHTPLQPEGEGKVTHWGIVYSLGNFIFTCCFLPHSQLPQQLLWNTSQPFPSGQVAQHARGFSDSTPAQRRRGWCSASLRRALWYLRNKTRFNESFLNSSEQHMSAEAVQLLTMNSPVWLHLLPEHRQAVVAQHSCIQRIDSLPGVGRGMRCLTMILYSYTRRQKTNCTSVSLSLWFKQEDEQVTKPIRTVITNNINIMISSKNRYIIQEMNVKSCAEWSNWTPKQHWSRVNAVCETSAQTCQL